MYIIVTSNFYHNKQYCYILQPINVNSKKKHEMHKNPSLTNLYYFTKKYFYFCIKYNFMKFSSTYIQLLTLNLT